MKKSSLLLCLLVSFLIPPLNAKELKKEETKPNIPIASKISYNIQRYSGFNFFIDSLAESVIKGLVKFKTHGRNINCKLEIFSGLDLLKKKIKSFNLNTSELKVKNIPVEYFELNTLDPLYFRKNAKKRYRVIHPADITAKVIIDPSSVIEILDNKSETGRHEKEIELPLPPFGSTKVLLQDLMIKISETGFIESTIKAVSATNPDSEPFIAMFSGNVLIEDKKLLISNLNCEAEDIFTKDSDIGMAFCKAINELINPIINFHKYEKRGITIDNVDLSFPENELFFKINLMLVPEGTNASNQK